MWGRKFSKITVQSTNETEDTLSLITHDEDDQNSNETKQNKIFSLAGVFQFYQTAALLHIGHRQSTENNVFISNIQSIINMIFTFSVFVHSKFSKICPKQLLDSIGKAVVDVSFLLTLFLIVIILYILKIIFHQIVRYICKSDDDIRCHRFSDKNKISFHLKLNQTLLHLTLLCYIGISKFCFQMINCVSIAGTKHLYIQGDLTCYTWWQILVFVFCCDMDHTFCIHSIYL